MSSSTDSDQYLPSGCRTLMREYHDPDRLRGRPYGSQLREMCQYGVKEAECEDEHKPTGAFSLTRSCGARQS